ncbi:MAG: sodium:proton antiporter [Acetobacter aceti]|uniref:Cation/H+ exchanger transmembrane domain-containing protein n=1 Tax=Acetobacter aceti TaxID=435 RepID=A0A1U9KD99_ACEAC|nr:sodium:proton antiporter [Acetobacter aceti]AQS83771.1 hypothetical protein A0U92_02160 [Acetobacter aceti]
MAATDLFEFLLLLLLLIIALEVVAQRLRLPSSIALIAGGTALAMIPGPRIEMPPELVLILFIPPLLLEGAYFTSWRGFRQNLWGILSLAIGAVLFTTGVVAWTVHHLSPGLSWATCLVLGAIVAPPDAVAARAALEKATLSRRVRAQLQGESLLNDAASLTLVRVAVVAAISHRFSIGTAMQTFSMLAAGGVAVGLVIGLTAIRIYPHLRDTSLVVLTSFLVSWASYIIGERLEVSGVLATVTTGMLIGWRQHKVFSASMRTQIVSFWKVVVFLMEAAVFMQIGFSLREITMRIGSLPDVWALYGVPVCGTLAALFLARFLWVYGAIPVTRACAALTGRPMTPLSWRDAFIVSWVGMRGVMTIAIALALPDDMPARSLIVVAAFTTVMVTVVLQGTSLGWIISLLGSGKNAEQATLMTRGEVMAQITEAQRVAAERLEPDAGVYPGLLDQFTQRAQRARDALTLAGTEFSIQRHEEALRAVNEAGREKLIELHRSGYIEDELMQAILQQLDHEELSTVLGTKGH